MLKTLTTLIITAATLSPALAKQATWFTNQNWAVVGNTEGYCTMASVYQGKGIIMTLGATQDGKIKLFLAGTTARKGGVYQNIFRTGASVGTFTGVAIEEGMLAYTISPNDLLKFAYAKTMHIEQMGAFDMTGSKQAVLEMLKCRRAMNGEDA